MSVNMFREAATHFRALDHPGRRWGLGGIALASAQLGEPEVGAAAMAELDLMPRPPCTSRTSRSSGAGGHRHRPGGDRAPARALLRQQDGRRRGLGPPPAASEALLARRTSCDW